MSCSAAGRNIGLVGFGLSGFKLAGFGLAGWPAGFGLSEPTPFALMHLKLMEYEADFLFLAKLRVAKSRVSVLAGGSYNGESIRSLSSAGRAFPW